MGLAQLWPGYFLDSIQRGFFWPNKEKNWNSRFFWGNFSQLWKGWIWSKGKKIFPNPSLFWMYLMMTFERFSICYVGLLKKLRQFGNSMSINDVWMISKAKKASSFITCLNFSKQILHCSIIVGYSKNICIPANHWSWLNTNTLFLYIFTLNILCACLEIGWIIMYLKNQSDPVLVVFL